MDINKENVRKWVDALRSGKYVQINGRLGSSAGYCCLGVACEVALENGVALSRKIAADPIGTVAYDDCGGELPDKVAEWLGFYYEGDDETRPSHGSDPYLPTPGHEGYTAVSWNDEEKANFATIADLIEREYLTNSKRDGG